MIDELFPCKLDLTASFIARISNRMMFPITRMTAYGAAFVSLFSVFAHAGLPGFRTRTTESPNGEYVLVLLTPDTERSNRHIVGPIHGWSEEDLREERESLKNELKIEAKYPESGLYRNDGTTTLLWRMPYLSVSKEIFVANDGIHVVVAFLNWECDTCSDRGNALEFYANGQQMAAYRENEFLVGYLGRLALSSYAGAAFPSCTAADFNEASGIFEITTNQGDVLGFDIRTGRLAYSSSPWSFFILAPVLTVSALAAWWLWHRVASRKRALSRRPM